MSTPARPRASTADDDRRGDEAGADEVAALAVLLARPAHVPGPRQEDADEDGEDAGLDEGPENLDGEALRLLPRQRDEFTCARCFLVAHISRRSAPGSAVCSDCS